MSFLRVYRENDVWVHEPFDPHTRALTENSEDANDGIVFLDDGLWEEAVICCYPLVQELTPQEAYDLVHEWYPPLELPT